MSYDFKKLSDVESVEEMGENDTVLIVQDGKVKQTSAVKGGSGDRVVLSDENVKLYHNEDEDQSYGIVTDELYTEIEEAWQKDPLNGVIIKGKQYNEENGDLVAYWFRPLEESFYWYYDGFASVVGHPVLFFVGTVAGFFDVIDGTATYVDADVGFVSESDFEIIRNHRE